MNILVTHKELDIAGYSMLENLSYREGLNIYIAVSSEREKSMVKGKCTPLMITPLNSKFVWKGIRQLRNIIKTYKIDVTYSPGSSGLSNVLFASWGIKLKHVAYRGTMARVRKSDPTYYLGILNPRVTHVVCVTKYIAEVLSEHFDPEMLSVIPKPFDVEWVEDARRHPKQVDGIPEGAVTGIYMADVKNRPRKGFTHLVNAINMLNNPNFHFILVGECDDSDYQLARNGPVGQCFHFPGHRADALHFLPLQDIYIQPSESDAFPRAVREAMSCELPCVVTNIPGPREIIVDGATGMLVPPRSPEELAKAIAWMIEHPEERKAMGKAGRKRIIDCFKTPRYYDEYETMFKSL